MPLTLTPAPEDTILGLSGAIRERRLSCRDLFERCRANYEQLEPTVQAWVTFGGDTVEQRIEQLDAELKAGQWRGPLHGIPIGVKDIYDVEGQPTLAGIPRASFAPATHDAALVHRLRKAGAVVVGKTVTTPYAFFDPPPTRNPWNTSRTPGGSSSGSAAAVATGMCLGALGSQTGGSITRPASFCGIAGYKPTFGKLSRDGMFPFAPSLDHPGPMARSVADLVCLLTGIESSPYRPLCRALLYKPSPKQPPQCVLLGGKLAERADAEILSAVEQSVQEFAAAGASVTHSDAAALDLPRLWKCHRTIMAVEIATSQGERLQQRPEEFTPAVRTLIEEGLATRSVDYSAAIQFQRDLRRRVRREIGKSIWLCPAAPGAAPTPETTGDPCMNSPWSFLGFPTITFPMRLSSSGLPLGLQLVAAPRRDGELFRAAWWCEARLRNHPA